MSTNPFVTIWLRPRDTVRAVVAQDPTFHVTLLACLAGIGEALDRASSRNLGDKVPLPVILGVACVFGPLGGLLSIWISSHLLRFTGNWLGGTAPREHLKAAIAWAAVPSISALPLWAAAILLVGSDAFTEETPKLDAEPLLWLPFMAIAVAEVILAIWSIALLCNTIAEVQGFRSAWRGLANLILSGAVIVVPLLLLVVAAVVLVHA